MEFKQTYPKRLFDVGIAEEHAMSMAGGLAKQGMTPVIALYSTFLQRSYDMILQDICMLNLPVVLAIDRAGLVGEDGETHHGIYDVGFLRHAPGMKILCPASLQEVEEMVRWAVKARSGPIAIRYPRGGNGGYTGSAWNADSSVCLHREGKDLTILTYGTLVNNAIEAAEILSKQGIDAGVMRLTCIQPVQVEEIISKLPASKKVFIAEEVAGNCGICEHISCRIRKIDPEYTVWGVDLGNRYIQHGAVDKLYDYYGLSPEQMAKSIMEVHRSES